MLNNTQPEKNPNDITIQSYEAEVMGYIEHTPATYQNHHSPLLKWIDFNLSHIDKGDRILEIGSGFGRDASYMRDKGYQIACTDGTPGFVDYLRNNGWDAHILNILKDEVPSGYKMVFANAVFPHFTSEQFETILSKIIKSLPAKGLFAFSVKQGRGEEWIKEKFAAKRFIHYWDPLALKKSIDKQDCKIIFWEEGIPGDLPSHTWTNLTIQKNS